MGSLLRIYKSRIRKLCKILDRHNIDAFLITDSSNIFYLSGLNISNCLLLINVNGKNYVFTDPRFKQEVTCVNNEFEVIILDKDNLVFKHINQICHKTNVKSLGIEANILTIDKFNKLTKNLSAVKILPKLNIIENLRIIKEPCEISNIKKAIKILDKIYKRLNELIDQNVTEWELANRLEYNLKKNFKTQFSFSPIIACDKNSSYPHARVTHDLISKSRFILVDIGAKFGGYSSDLTRIFVLSKMSPKQNRVFNLLLELQEGLLNSIKPGIDLSQIDKISREKLAKAGFGENIMHSVGHGVGIDVHESPYINYRNSCIAKPGMVFTIEPGLYFPRQWGIRIEDMVLVTESGCKVLTDKIPK